MERSYQILRDVSFWLARPVVIPNCRRSHIVTLSHKQCKCHFSITISYLSNVCIYRAYNILWSMKSTTKFFIVNILLPKPYISLPGPNAINIYMIFHNYYPPYFPFALQRRLSFDSLIPCKCPSKEKSIIGLNYPKRDHKITHCHDHYHYHYVEWG